ncbi:hypothetical protein TRVA0_116S00122 [Trichomonascus vanleenenianus]|uniref:uncharacterized protein n=1 Tax=Trichomonascus vanleenenianus TaxID=2268995 RepID=UPI003EC99C1D
MALHTSPYVLIHGYDMLNEWILIHSFRRSYWLCVRDLDPGEFLHYCLFAYFSNHGNFPQFIFHATDAILLRFIAGVLIPQLGLFSEPFHFGHFTEPVCIGHFTILSTSVTSPSLSTPVIHRTAIPQQSCLSANQETYLH